MQTDIMQSELRLIARQRLPRNARQFKYVVYDGSPQRSVLGFPVAPKPFEGTVVGVTDEAVYIRTARTTFAVIDRALSTTLPEVDARVQVTPYARRHFDGSLVDVPLREATEHADGAVANITTYVLGGAHTRLPLPDPQCPQLAELIHQLEELPAPDGFRRIAHLLVDAGAKDFTLVDPTPANILRTPPTVAFTVATAKFVGDVAIQYNRGLDTYTIVLMRSGEPADRHEDIYFDDLGEVLERLIDDGAWRQVRIEIVQARRRAH